MKDPRQLDHLEDGQTSFRISIWQERLSGSRDEVLSVLHAKINCAASDKLCATLDGSEAEIRILLQDLWSLLRLAEDRLPKPQGFFVGKGERQAAYEVICRMMLPLESCRRRVDVLASGPAAQLRQLQALQQVARSAESDLAEVLTAAKAAAPEMQRSLQEMLDTLRQACDTYPRLQARIVAQQELLRTLRTTLLPSFCQAISQSADLEREGLSCNPSALLRLCGELQLAIQNTQFSTN